MKNLHRSEKQSDWQDIPDEDLNIWQKVAKKTNGVVTLGNAISVGGAMIFASGLKDMHQGRVAKGAIKVGIGRLADLADGLGADLTKTKSRGGASLDAVLDKVEIFAGIPVFIEADIISVETALEFGIQNVANAVLTGVAKKRGYEIQSSREGKETTFHQWGTICLGTVARVLEDSESGLSQLATELAEDVTKYTANKLGKPATLGYLKDVLFGSPELANELPLEVTPDLYVENALAA